MSETACIVSFFRTHICRIPPYNLSYSPGCLPRSSCNRCLIHFRSNDFPQILHSSLFSMIIHFDITYIIILYFQSLISSRARSSERKHSFLRFWLKAHVSKIQFSSNCTHKFTVGDNAIFMYFQGRIASSAGSREQK